MAKLEKKAAKLGLTVKEYIDQRTAERKRKKRLKKATPITKRVNNVTTQEEALTNSPYGNVADMRNLYCGGR